MNLKIPASTPASSTLHIEANRNFCDWVSEGTPVTGPVAMVFDIGDLVGAPPEPDADTDTACIDVSPQYDTLDISSAFCLLGF